MRRKLVILAVVLVLCVVGWSVSRSIRVYSRVEVGEYIAGGVGSGWIAEQVEVTGALPRGIFEGLFDRLEGSTGIADSGADVFMLRRGGGCAVFIVHHEGNDVKFVELRRSKYPEELKSLLQKRFPGIRCRIVSP